MSKEREELTESSSINPSESPDCVTQQEEGDMEQQQQPSQHELELELIAKLRLSFSSTLNMFEAARDNLVLLGNRMDRLRDKSKKCREALDVMPRDEVSAANNERNDNSMDSV